MRAAIGALRSDSSVIAMPMKARMLIHHGTRQRPKNAMPAMNTKNGMCAGSWKSGDCHSVMFAIPQSPESM